MALLLNIDRKIKMVSYVAILCIIMSFSLSAYTILASIEMVENTKQNIYVLNGEVPMLAERI